MVNIKYKPHQKFVIDHFKEYDPFGLLLYHGLGSGKTITSIGVCELYNKTVICIVPAPMQAQWASELRKVGVKRKKYKIFSYEVFCNKISEKAAITDAIIIVDEAHRLRNQGARFLHIYKMIQDAFKVILLTGTPMINHPADFSNLANLIYKKKVLESSQKEFDKKYHTVEKKITDSRIKKAAFNEWKKLIKCTVSYHFPDRSADYPAVSKKLAKVKMSLEQNTDYKHALKMLSKVDQTKMERGSVIKDITQINAFLNETRQISNVALSFKHHVTPKLDAILRKVVNGPKPVIIYSHYLDCGLNPMGRILEKHGVKFNKFTGAMSLKARRHVIKRYNQGKLHALLVSSSGAEGLDLKNTRQIHIMEPHWNVAKIDQVIGRGIRYKSHENLPAKDRHVTVYYWVAVPILKKGSDKLGADEYLYQINENKVKLMENYMRALVKTSIENKFCSTKPHYQKKLISTLF